MPCLNIATKKIAATKRTSYKRWTLIAYCMFFLFYSTVIRAQVVSCNNGFISIASGTVVGVDSISNDAASTITNDGTINLFTINNSGITQGNGTLNITKNFTNTGTFLPGTSTVNYKGSINQIIIPVNYYNLTVTENGTRTITLDSSDIIGIANEFSVAGGNTSYLLTGTTLDFNGTSPQNIPAFPFNNLTVDNSAGATLDGTSTIEGILSPVSGDFNTNDFLTLLSTASRTALIDGSGNGEVLGNVTMQRYLASGFGYKYLSSPFQSALVNELSDDMDLTDSFPTFYRYDENQVSSGWIAYTDTTGMLIPMQGYAANLGAASFPKTIDITGVVNNDTMSCTLYNHDHLYTQGFNLIGNPYPSPIDWDITNGWMRTNIDVAIYYFDAGDTNQYTGTYSSYVNGISSDSVAVNIIPAMQGFFIHVTDGSFPVAAELTINNIARSRDFSGAFHRPASLPLLRLYAGFTGATTADPCVFYLDDEASTGFNKNLDGLKLMNTNAGVPNLYVVSGDSQKLSIRAFTYPHDSLTVLPLGLKIQRSGSITFNAQDILLMPEELYIYLLDSENGTYHDLRQTQDYHLYLETGKYENRFFVVFSLKELNSNSVDNEIFDVFVSRGQLFINTNIQTDENSTLVISNMLGLQMSSQQFKGNRSYKFNSFLSSGMYMVSLFANKGVHSKKIIIAN